jgi:hypothetical protein
MRGHPVAANGVAGFKDVAARSYLQVHHTFQDEHDLLCGMVQGLLAEYGVDLQTPLGDLHASMRVRTQELIDDGRIGHDEPAASVMTNHRVWALQEEVVDGDFKGTRYGDQGLN